MTTSKDLAFLEERREELELELMAIEKRLVLIEIRILAVKARILSGTPK